jgi:hypothetical protein
MPPKRTTLQHFNPVKHQAIDLLSDPQSPPEGNFSEHSEDDMPAVKVPDTSSDAVSSTLRSPDNHALTASPATVSAVLPKSPVSNRERFLAGFVPARTCCNLELCRAPAGSKFDLSGICIAVFPAITNPDRRYILLADCTGSIGVTVWNSNVNKFSNESVGLLVSLHKVSISSHHGKKQLTMARDSSVDISSDPLNSVVHWWQQLLMQVPKSCGTVHDVSDNDIVSVSGICGHVTSDVKMVNSVERTLTSVHLVDSSGRFDIRSWNHIPDVFLQYIDRPVIFKRIRVTSFAGSKIGELLDGSGSVVETEFPGKTALAKYWTM